MCYKCLAALDELTRHNVSGIHGVLILNETKAIHQLDLRDLTRSMGTEVLLDILFSYCPSRNRVSSYDLANE